MVRRLLVLLLALFAWAPLWGALGALSTTPALSAEPHRFATVPALTVGYQHGTSSGGVSYITIQLDPDPQQRGPSVYFSERASGSTFGDEWKAGVHRAVAAAARVLGEDPRKWTVTIKHSTYTNSTEGSSASSIVAVGIMAAWRGDTLRSGMVLTGMVTPDGQIAEVGELPTKLQGAALARMHTMLVPRGQARTDEWDLHQQASQTNMTVVEVASLQEAYELMTGKKP
jgi:predicted S18 family serine protease